MRTVTCVMLVLLLVFACGCVVREPGPAPNALTNTLTGYDLPEGAFMPRPVAVVVDNSEQAWPQRGIYNADIIYEMTTEFGATRMLCLYSGANRVGVVGPIRSAGAYLMACTFALDPLYVQAGASVFCADFMQTWEADILDFNHAGGYFWRDTQRLRGDSDAFEHCLYTDGGNILNACDDMGYATVTKEGSHAFGFALAGETVLPMDGEAHRVTFPFSENPFYDGDFRYNEQSALYFKFQRGAAQIDETNGIQLSFDNVFLLYASYTLETDGYSVRVRFEEGGRGYYFSMGRYAEIIWEKPVSGGNFEFYLAETGQPLIVNCGKSFVAVADKEFSAGVEIT